MKPSEKILLAEEKYARGKITMIQFRKITTLADNLGKYDEALKKIGHPDMTMGEADAEDYISELCEELDNDYDPSDPESWECDEDEYTNRLSHLANKAHEAAEGER